MEMWMSVIRNVLLAVGPLITYYAKLQEAEWAQIVGVVMIVASLIWKVFERKRQTAKLARYEAMLTRAGVDFTE